mmetsp:Transcript_8113/g.18424  ORF Transcript_8113/g.18424 Transcript_8113/m.18424 type:complete len:223 (-) Transcript_8113:70-738(-)
MGPSMPCYRAAAAPRARALAARRFASGACLLLAAAVAALALKAPTAPNAFAGVSRVQPERIVSVACGVKSKYLMKRMITAEFLKASDEELHTIIAEGHKNLWEFRLAKWQKRMPSKFDKYTAEYKTAVAKTILKQREIDANAKAALEAGEQQRPTMSELVTKEETIDAFERFAYKPGLMRGARFVNPSRRTIHYTPESKKWAAENIPEEEEEDAPAEDGDSS